MLYIEIAIPLVERELLVFWSQVFPIKHLEAKDDP
jgi:hypothetical protein